MLKTLNLCGSAITGNLPRYVRFKFNSQHDIGFSASTFQVLLRDELSQDEGVVHCFFLSRKRTNINFDFPRHLPTRLKAFGSSDLRWKFFIEFVIAIWQPIPGYSHIYGLGKR